MLDVRAGEQVRLGVGGVRGDLVGNAVVGAQSGVVVAGQLGLTRGGGAVPQHRVEVDQVRLSLALKNIKADCQARAPNRRGVGDGSSGKALRLELRELADEGVVVSAHDRYKRLLCGHVLVDDCGADARGSVSVIYL